MDEVKMMQNRVLDAQDKFVQAQESRREAGKALSTVQNRLKDIYNELDATSRGEERYLQLITQEHAVLKEERRLQAEFGIREKEERETFSLLSNCVKESHEKERAQAERTKYWSVIGSVFGTIIGILGSSINNEFKMRELRKLVKESTMKPDVATSLLNKHEQELNSILNDMKNLLNLSFKNKENISEHAIASRLDQLLHSVSGKHEEEKNSYINESVRRLNQNMQELKSIINSAQKYDGQLLAIPVDLEGLINAQKNETRLVLAGVTFVGIVVPILITYFLKLT
ncbi:hypothetical protein AAG570_006589 [Ranatra chinensis]|uniref:Coiled-coil domain-containing protein 51 n=1 Tax=Ranatra chinensis TaxID=642074 RepID=A0ABD0YUH8_9HEMI